MTESAKSSRSCPVHAGGFSIDRDPNRARDFKTVTRSVHMDKLGALTKFANWYAILTGMNTKPGRTRKRARRQQTSDLAGQRPRGAILGIVIGIAISPLDPAMASAVSSDAHAGHKLGKVNFSVSCSEEAQTEFNRAVALLHHMTRSEEHTSELQSHSDLV